MKLINSLRDFSLLLGLISITTPACFLFLYLDQAKAQNLPTSTMLQEGPCEILLGEGGYTRQAIVGAGDYGSLDDPDVPNDPDAFSFIRFAFRPCYYIMYNEANFNGRTAVYGALDDRVRIGSEGADNGGGWRARSMRAVPMYGNCTIILGDGGVSQYFLGPGEYSSLTGWNFVRSTQGPCTFEVFNGPGFDGRVASYSSGVDGNTRVGWRIRSIRIR